MSLAELKDLKRRVIGKRSSVTETEIGDGTGLVDVRQLRRDNEKLAKDLNSRFTELGEIIKSKRFGGKLDLGVNPDEVSWESMPEELVSIFKPEFAFQPEEITSFCIEPKLVSPGRVGISIDLERNRSPWSYVTVEAIVRKDYVAGSSYVSCQSDISQVKAAREAMKSLNDSLWGRNPIKETKVSDQSRSLLTHSYNELVFGEKVLNFVVGEVKRRIQDTL